MASEPARPRTSLPGLEPPRPLPLKERSSIIFVERAQLDVDGAFVALDVNGVRTHIPVGAFACVMLEPGTRVSHAAVALAARAGTLLVWVGEAGVRLYASGQPGGRWQCGDCLERTDRRRLRFRYGRSEQAEAGRFRRI